MEGVENPIPALPNEVLVMVIESIPCSWENHAEHGKTWLAVMLTCRSFHLMASIIIRKKFVESLSGIWTGTLGWLRWQGENVENDTPQSMKPNFHFVFDAAIYREHYSASTQFTPPPTLSFIPLPTTSTENTIPKPSYCKLWADENKNEGTTPNHKLMIPYNYLY